MSIWARFLTNEDGATAIEYGLIVAGIALAITAGTGAISTAIKANFTTVSTALK